MGISPVIIGGAIAAAGAVGGAAISASASESAAQTQQQAAQSSNATQIYMQQQAIAQQNQMLGVEGQLFNPNRQAGNYATQALQSALGLPLTTLQPVNLGAGTYPGGTNATISTGGLSPSVAGGTAGGTISSGGLGAGGGVGGGVGPGGSLVLGGTSPINQLVDTSTGVPQANAGLYQSNPQYRQAWDAVAAANQAKYGTGYTTSSDPANLTKELQQALGPNAGTVGGSQFSNLFQPFNYTADQFHQSPGYQFALGQGLEAIQNSASARGMTLSPNTQKDLASYATGLADQDYQQAYSNAFQAYSQNQSNTINALGSIAGYGNTAISNLGSAAGATGANNASLTAQLGSALGGNIIGAGNAAAAGQIGTSNAISGGLQSLGNIYTQSQQLNNLNANNYGFTLPGGNAGGGYNYTNPNYGLGSGLNYNINQ